MAKRRSRQQRAQTRELIPPQEPSQPIIKMASLIEQFQTQVTNLSSGIAEIGAEIQQILEPFKAKQPGNAKDGHLHPASPSKRFVKSERESVSSGASGRMGRSRSSSASSTKSGPFEENIWEPANKKRRTKDDESTNHGSVSAEHNDGAKSGIRTHSASVEKQKASTTKKPSSSHEAGQKEPRRSVRARTAKVSIDFITYSQPRSSASSTQDGHQPSPAVKLESLTPRATKSKSNLASPTARPIVKISPAIEDEGSVYSGRDSVDPVNFIAFTDGLAGDKREQGTKKPLTKLPVATKGSTDGASSKLDARKILIVVGGATFPRLKVTDTVEAYSFDTNQWENWTPLPEKRCAAGIAVVENNIFVLGGFDDSSKRKTINHDSVKKYNFAKKTWTEAAPLPSGRSAFATVVANKLIYVVGGSDGTTTQLKSLDQYDPVLDKWTSLAPLKKGRMRLAAVYAEGSIYALGGANDVATNVNIMERYDIASGKWHTLKDMPQSRDDFTACYLDGFIYVIAGLMDDNRKEICQRYSIKTEEWTEFKPPKHKHSGAGLAVDGGKIYLVGGKENAFEEKTALNAVEMYDTKTESWTDLVAMNTRRLSCGAAILNVPI